MKDKNIFKMLIIVAVIISVLVISLILVKLLDKEKNPAKYIPEDQQAGEEITDILPIDTSVKKVDNRHFYYTIKDCINKFYIFISSIGEGEDEQEEQDITKKIYDMLDEDYINYKGITKENLNKKIQKINESNINITDMYVSQKNDNIYLYMAYGTLREKISGNINNFKIMIKIDSDNKTFSIFMKDYMDEKIGNIETGDKIDINTENNIENKQINIYGTNIISDDEYVVDLFNKYKEEILYNSELAYEHLNTEYREKRFGTIENYKNYLKNNVVKNVVSRLDSYQKSEINDYTQYICIDQNGKYYIFREKSVMDYTVMLDSYTVKIPEFIELYNSAKDYEKVGLNIQNAFMALNDGDYKYVYNKLDETFKNNNYKTQTDFEKYIKSQLFTNNQVTYKKYEQSGNIYIYTLEITDKDRKESRKVDMQVVMALGEGTDFTMSFSIN